MKRLNAALEFTLTSSFASKRNTKNPLFHRKLSPVQAWRPFQAKVYQISSTSELKRYEFGNSASEKQSMGYARCLSLTEKKNRTPTQHNILFPCSENVELRETEDNVANNNCLTK